MLRAFIHCYDVSVAVETGSASPVVAGEKKRGRGRPPKSETEIPHTNLVRTNQLFLPLKKRHKMVEDYSTGMLAIWCPIVCNYC